MAKYIQTAFAKGKAKLVARVGQIADGFVYTLSDFGNSPNRPTPSLAGNAASYQVRYPENSIGIPTLIVTRTYAAQSGLGRWAQDFIRRLAY